MDKENKMKNFNVFVGGLSSDTTKEDLVLYFEKFGEVKKCEPQMWKSSKKKCRGFALLTVAEESTYHRIIKAQHIIKGRNVECKKAFKSKKELRKYENDLKGRKIFVGGLPLSLTTDQLLAYFKKIAPVDIAYIVKNSCTKSSRGFGYVCFSEKEGCRRALEAKNLVIKGKAISCSPYRSKPKSPEDDRSHRLTAESDLNYDENEMFNIWYGRDLIRYDPKLGAFFNLRRGLSPKNVIYSIVDIIRRDNRRSITNGLTELSNLRYNISRIAQF